MVCSVSLSIGKIDSSSHHGYSRPATYVRHPIRKNKMLVFMVVKEVVLPTVLNGKNIQHHIEKA